MTKENAIKLFQDQRVRVQWDDEQEKWFNAYIRTEQEKMYMIIPKAKTKAARVPIGVIGIYNIDFKENTAKIGRMIIGNRRYRARGLASDAVRTILKFALDMLKLEKVSLEFFSTNRRALRLYARCGFKQDSRRFITQGNKQRKVMVMSISKGKK